MKTFEKQMEEQRDRARAARTQELVCATDITTAVNTEFTGFDEDVSVAKVLEVHEKDNALLVITDRTPFYAEMGGQLGDQGILTKNNTSYIVSKVQQIACARSHSIPLGML